MWSECFIKCVLQDVSELKSGFWQVKVSEDSRQYTAFTVGSMGVYEFLRMPYGLCNALVMFQHLMQNCLGELNLSFAMVYLDDVIVYSEMPEDHLTSNSKPYSMALLTMGWS